METSSELHVPPCTQAETGVGASVGEEAATGDVAWIGIITSVCVSEFVVEFSEEVLDIEEDAIVFIFGTEVVGTKTGLV